MVIFFQKEVSFIFPETKKADLAKEKSAREGWEDQTR